MLCVSCVKADYLCRQLWIVLTLWSQQAHDIWTAGALLTFNLDSNLPTLMALTSSYYNVDEIHIIYLFTT